MEQANSLNVGKASSSNGKTSYTENEENNSDNNNQAKEIFSLEEPESGPGKSRIWTLRFDLVHEKVNKLNREVMGEFEKLLPRLEKLGAEKKIDALLLVSGKPGNFLAGADIEMIRATKTREEAEELSRGGQVLMERWEDLPFPTIAAVNGVALGGGCEFALACTAIVMSKDKSAKIGLPEVMLGVIPGMGGCVRLPRKVGLATALDMILTGKQLNSDRAYRAGLVEASLPRENFNETAHRWVELNLKALHSGKRLAKEPKLGGMGGPIGAILEKTPAVSIVFKKAREGVLSKTRGLYPAPLEAIDVLRDTGATYGDRLRGKERSKAMAREAKGFGRMAATQVSKNLINLFFLTEAVKKSNGLEGGKKVKVSDFEQAAVLGAGVMGGGIAQLFAAKDIPTRMKDLNNKALAIGVQSASAIFQKQVKRKRITNRQFAQKLSKITPLTDFSGFNHTEMVVEAIIENMDIKKSVLKDLESHVSSKCVIATNTSSLSVTEMQSVLSHPERFVGMHFFNPVHRMPLIEVIRGEKTSDEAVASIFEFSKRLGKTPVVVKDAPGFLVNRLLATYLNEAVYLAVEGNPIPDLDRAMLEYGMPMGPMELIDEVGVDVGEKVATILHKAFGDRLKPADLNAKIVASGRLGKKVGKGVYVYEGPKKSKRFDPKIYEIIGVSPKTAVADEEMVERCVLPMINEAARCLEEKVVDGPDQVDLGMIMGTGFPPFRGGLLRYADSVGLSTVVDRLNHYAQIHGSRFEPSEALKSLVKNGQTFYKS